MSVSPLTDEPEHPSKGVLLSVLEAVLIAGLSALFTGLVEKWLDEKDG